MKRLRLILRRNLAGQRHLITDPVVGLNTTSIILGFIRRRARSGYSWGVCFRFIAQDLAHNTRTVLLWVHPRLGVAFARWRLSRSEYSNG